MDETPTQPAVMRDGTQVEDRRLGRLIEFDERSRDYPVAAVLERRGLDTSDSARIRSYRWRVQDWYDQRSEGACVLFAEGHAAAARPREQRGFTFDQLIGYYHRAQDIDEWASTHQGGEGGTSVLAGAKVMTAEGHYVGYDWVLGRDEGLRIALVTLAYLRPLVMGTWWKSSMWDTDGDGKLDVTGHNVGGHAWLTYGLVARDARGKPAHRIGDLDLDRSRVWDRNSWGRGWGRDGDFWLTVREWNDLRLDQGDCMAPRERGGYFGG